MRRENDRGEGRMAMQLREMKKLCALAISWLIHFPVF